MKLNTGQFYLCLWTNSIFGQIRAAVTDTSFKRISKPISSVTRQTLIGVKNVWNGRCRRDWKRDFVFYAQFSQVLLFEVITERQRNEQAITVTLQVYELVELPV